MKEKKGKKLVLKLINKRLLINHPKSILLFPILKKIFPYTMLSYTALYEMNNLINEVDKKQIKGSIVEMGCWSGGCGAFMAWRTKKNKSNRDIWLFDSFEGIPELSIEDKEWARKLQIKVKEKSNNSIQPAKYYVTTEDRAKEVLRKVDALENVRIIKGWFQNSLPDVVGEIGSIAILRLDADIYESTKYCLEELYDLVSPGGLVVVDDFHLEGCRRAIYEFFYLKNISPKIIGGNFGGRHYFYKK